MPIIMDIGLLSSIAVEFIVIKRIGRNRLLDVALLCLAAFLVIFAPLLIAIMQPSIATAVLPLLGVMRFLTMLRIAEERMHSDELKRRSMRTFRITAIVSIIVYMYAFLRDDSYAVSIFVLLYAQLCVAVILASSVFLSRALYRYKPSKPSPDALPTVSVCIPARNETADLPECIESVLASTYPKLEIIVLDDCSHDKTPEIIKGYAHAGVRFVNGKEPRDDWLAKNAAYDRLADEARGDILLFVGVDVRLQSDSIQQLVNQMNNHDMMAVMPRRPDAHEAAFFIQPLRYWWELGLWRFRFSAPPVLSTCWAIRAEVLQKLGTFESVKKAVEPEAVFARSLASHNKYAFLVSNDEVGVHSVKTPSDQYQTALRKRYAQVRRRPETAAFVLAVEIVFVFAPFATVVWAAFNSYSSVFVISLACCILLSISNAEVYKLSLRRLWPLGFISVPALVVADVALMLRSMYAYEFGKVIWKDRNICLPLLKVEKSLPKLD